MVSTLIVKRGRGEKHIILCCCPDHTCKYGQSSGMFWGFLEKRGDGDVISGLFFLSTLQSEGGEGVFLPLVETLGPRSEPVALPGSLFKEMTQSPHLCCIMGLHSGRPSETPH